MLIITAYAPADRGHLYGDGAPVAKTGGFGEMSCRECHWENPLNDGGPRAEITGLPNVITAGAKYEVTVQLRRPEMKIAGFQLSARHDSGSAAGKQAGTFRPLDARTQLTKNDTTAVTYLTHTRSGTVLSQPGTATWKFEWTAPSTPYGPVVVHLAANAADDNNSEGGDYVYTTSTRMTLSGLLLPKRRSP